MTVRDCSSYESANWPGGLPKPKVDCTIFAAVVGGEIKVSHRRRIIKTPAALPFDTAMIVGYCHHTQIDEEIEKTQNALHILSAAMEGVEA